MLGSRPLAAALQSPVEWWVVVAFAVLTQLGDVWFLFVLGGGLYVAGETLPWMEVDRRRGLFVLALVLAYIALIGVLKAFFDVPRPPGASDPPPQRWIPDAFAVVFADITTGTGNRFPSGHALGTTMVWGGLGLILDQYSRWLRVGVPAVVVAIVGVARVVLGVHYPIDVVAGVAIGVVVLAGLYWFGDAGRDPQVVLFVASIVGIIGVLDGINFESVAAAGAAVGGWLVWLAVAESTPARPRSRGEVLGGFVVLGVAAALFGALYANHPPSVVAFAGAATAGGLIVGAPLLGERIA